MTLGLVEQKMSPTDSCLAFCKYLQLSPATIYISQVIENFYWQSVSRADVDMARVLSELLFVRLGNFHLYDFDTQALIVCLCTD